MGYVGEAIYKIRGDNSEFQKDVNETEQIAAQKTEKIGKVAKGVLVGIGAAATAAGAASIKMGMEYDSSLAKASTLFGSVEVDQQALADSMLDLSSKTGIAAADMGEALYNALSAGVPASEDMSEALAYLESNAQLARAGFTDIDTAASATISVLNAYGLSLEETDRVQKILMQTQNQGITTIGELGNTLSKVTPIAASNKVSFEQVGAAMATITAQKTPAAEATTQLRSMIKELGAYGSKASENLKAAAEGSEYAGMSFQEMMDAGADLSDVLLIMSDYAEDAGMSISDLFSDQTGGQAALVLTQQAESFTDALGEMATEADVVGEAVDKLNADPAQQMADALNELKNVGIELYENVLRPIVIAAGEAVHWMTEHKELVLTLTILVAGLALGLVVYSAAQAAAAAGTTVLTAVTGGLAAAFTALTAPITLIILAIAALVAATILIVKHWEEIKTFLLQIWTDISTFFIQIWTDVSTFFIQLWEDVSGFFIGIWETISQWFIDKITAISQTFTDVWTAISTFFTDLWTSISEFFIGIWETISGTFQAACEFVSGIFEGLSSTITDIWEGIKGVFQGVLDWFNNTFVSGWATIWSSVSSFFTGIWEGIKAAFKAPINWIIDGINKFIRGLNNVKIPDWVPLVGGKGFHLQELARLKVGLDYVPSDDFPALLHKGEAVLTADDAEIWRQQQRNGLAGMLNGLVANVIVASPALAGAGAGETVYNFEIPKLADSIVIREDADIDRISTALFDRFAAEKRSRGLF